MSWPYCSNCKAVVSPDFVMLDDEWALIAEFDSVLCIPCVESRIVSCNVPAPTKLIVRGVDENFRVESEEMRNRVAIRRIKRDSNKSQE